MNYHILHGDAIEQLKTLPDQSVHCCVTSPPYWGLRDYGVKDQIGLEPTPQEFVARLVEVFAEVRRVLRDDGTLWINMGDCYAGSGRGGNTSDTSGLEGTTESQEQSRKARGSIKPTILHKATIKSGAIGRAWTPAPRGLKQKDLCGMPWRLAFALQADGWYLRQDIIWCLSGGAWVYARTQKGEMPVMVKDLVRLPTTSVAMAHRRIEQDAPLLNTSSAIEVTA